MLHRPACCFLRSLWLLALLLIASASPALAQVVIKESVEIKEATEAASASKQTSGRPRKGPLRGAWGGGAVIETAPDVFAVKRVSSRRGYLTLAYTVRTVHNISPDGQILINIESKDGAQRSVTNNFGPGNFADSFIENWRRCGGGFIPYELTRYTNANAFSSAAVFAADSVGLVPEFARFDVGMISPGDTLIITVLTDSNSEGDYRSVLFYSFVENVCQIDPTVFREESVGLTSFFEWLPDTLAVFAAPGGAPVHQNDSTRISVVPKHEDGAIAEIDPQAMIRLELDSEAARLGYLQGPDGNTGSTLEVPFEDAKGDVFYYANDSDPTVVLDPVPVKITATQVDDEEVFGEKEFYVGGHTFTLEVVPDTVDFGEIGLLTVTAIDPADSSQVNLPDETTVTVFAPRNFLFSADSSMTGTSIDVPYGEARSGQIQFKVLDFFLPFLEPTVRRTSLSASYFYEPGVIIGGFGEVYERYIPRIELEFSQDPDTYLPIKNDLIEVTATVIPRPPPGSMVTFELTQADDFTFEDSTVAPKMVPVMGKEAKVKIKSQEYWGVATVKATYVRPEPGKDDLEEEQQLPVDTDDDGIADVWELDPANGGTLALGASDRDENWDEEEVDVDGDMVPDTPNLGDNFLKLDEYKGALVDGVHRRFSPEEKEVFVNTTGIASSQSAFAIAEYEAQLGFKVIPFTSIVFLLNPTTLPNSVPREVFMQNSGSLSATNNGLIVVMGVPTGQSAIRFGESNRDASLGRGAFTAQVYETTISNFFTGNSVDESVPALIHIPVPVAGGTGTECYVAVIDGTDLDGGGLGFVNPFDLLAPPPVGPPTIANNDAFDSIVATLSQGDFLLRNTLHESGHAVGIGPGHPATGNSVMRRGVGPAKTDDFTSFDRGQVRLK